jgi:hypothetical protein
MKFTVLIYETNLKQVVLNRLHFDTKEQMQEYLGITKNQLDNFIYGERIKGRRKSISILQRTDIFRKYSYGNKSIEDVYKMAIQDIEEVFKYVKKNLKQVKA